MDDYKLRSDEKKTVLRSQPDRSFNISTRQTPLPKTPPLLEFKRQKGEIKKDSVEQKTIQKGDLNNHEENTNRISLQKAIIQYPLYTDKLIDYYRQISQPLIQLYLDSLKLQKDYIDVFEPQWVDHVRTALENYLVFQDKMMFLYIQNYNSYLKSISDIKNNNNHHHKKMEK